MALNKFGQYQGAFKVVDKFGRGQQTVDLAEFTLTSDNNYNILGKRMTQVGNPVNDFDAVNKIYFETSVESKLITLKKAILDEVETKLSKLHQELILGINNRIKDLQAALTKQ